MAANKIFKQSLKYLGGIICHGLEYLIRHEVSLFYILAQLKTFLNSFYISTAVRIKLRSQFKPDLNQI